MPIDSAAVHCPKDHCPDGKAGLKHKKYVADVYIYNHLATFTATRPFVNLMENSKSSIHKNHDKLNTKTMHVTKAWWDNYKRKFEGAIT